MTQALNFTPKAIADLRAVPNTMPIGKIAFDYIASKLAQAQVFLLPDHGELLDRSKPHPEVPGITFKPPFDVVALEYTSQEIRRSDPLWTAVRSSRRIALAWEWKDDLPPPFFIGNRLGAGVGIASVFYLDEHQCWATAPGIAHLRYDEQWGTPEGRPSIFAEAMIRQGALSPKSVHSAAYPITYVPLLWEALELGAHQAGEEFATASLEADISDERSAYLDLCYALACKNVSTEERPAPAALNRQRLKKGKLPLTGFHILKLRGEEIGGVGSIASDRSGPRSHLRRGHIRRLGPDRITWVNSAIVRGRGFLDKVYAL